MAQTLNGQVGWVTGGGKGIGRAIALHLAARGARVVVTGRDEKAIAGVVGEIVNGGGHARHVAGDVRDPAHLEAAVRKTIDAFGGLHLVVANAGVAGRIDIDGGDRTRADAIFQTNLVGTYATFAAAVPAMKGPGRLVAVASGLGKIGVPGYAAYCASKAGVIGMMRALAQELGPRKITANAVCPGWVDTEMARSGLREIAEAMGTNEDAARGMATSAFPLGRFVEPDEVAELVAFLCSRAGDAITGQALSICGGATA